MGHANLDFTPIIAAVPKRTVPAQLKMAGIGMVVIGLAAAGYGFATDTDRFFASFVFNFMYFMGIA